MIYEFLVLNPFFLPLTIKQLHGFKKKLMNIECTSDVTSTIHNNALTYVPEKEHDGHVKGVGSGITPTLMNLEAFNKSHPTQMKMKMKDLKKLFEEFKAVFIENISIQKVINMVKKPYV